MDITKYFFFIVLFFLLLLFCCTDRISYPLKDTNNKYDVGSGEHFDDLVGLIEHFRLYPLIEASGDVLRLLQPVSGTCLRAKDIKQKVQEMDEVRVIENSGFDDGFQIIKMTEDTNVYTTNEGMKTDNSNKNRYSNILPYDETRVVLRNNDTDYINANYIRCSRLRNSSSSVQSSTESLNSVSSLIVRSESKQIVPIVTKSLSDDALRDAKKFMAVDKVKRNKHTVKNKFYIATQGCLPNTIDDFWHMLWQEDVRVIAMITNEIENGKKKCERYWPLIGTKENFGSITVKSLSETCYEDYLVREFLVKHNSIYRTIYQYQYKNWPDHGTPLEPHGVLALIEDINSRMYQISQNKLSPRQNILCVHCSAGVGRTGTFIVLDLLLDKIKMSGFNCEIDVHDTVKLVRSQRYGMVQNKRQYAFINLALQTYVDNNNIKFMKKVHFDNI